MKYSTRVAWFLIPLFLLLLVGLVEWIILKSSPNASESFKGGIGGLIYFSTLVAIPSYSSIVSAVALLRNDQLEAGSRRDVMAELQHVGYLNTIILIIKAWVYAPQMMGDLRGDLLRCIILGFDYMFQFILASIMYRVLFKLVQQKENENPVNVIVA